MAELVKRKFGVAGGQVGARQRAHGNAQTCLWDRVALAPRARQKRSEIGGHSSGHGMGQTSGNCTEGKPMEWPRAAQSGSRQKTRRSRYRCAEANGREGCRQSRNPAPQGAPKRAPRSTGKPVGRAPCRGARPHPQAPRALAGGAEDGGDAWYTRCANDVKCAILRPMSE